MVVFLYYWFIGFIVGNSITSLIDAESVKNIINLSIPIPNPRCV